MLTVRRKIELGAAVLALCVFSAMDSAMAPAQEQVIRAFHLTVVQYGWVSAAQFLFIAISAPLIGRCGDVFDKRSVLAVSLAMACVGGWLSSHAHSVWVYMVAQVLLCAWVGAGTVTAALVAEASDPENKVRGQGLLQGATGFFATAGLLGAAPTMQALGTLSLFWLPALVGLPCALYLGRHLLRQQPGPTHALLQQVDSHGGLMLGGLLVLLTVGLQCLSQGGRMVLPGIACLAMMAVVLPLWLRAQGQHASPFVDVTLFTRRDVACIHLIALALGIGTTSVYFLLPMLITAASAAGANFGSSAALVGALLLPLGAAGVLLIPFYGPLDRHLGPRGVLAMALGLIVVSLVIPILWHGDILPLLVCTSLFGFGLALVYTEGLTELLRIVPPERAAGASSTFTLAKTIGSMLGATGFAIALGVDGNAGAVAGLPQLGLAFGFAAAVSAAAMLALFGIGSPPPLPTCAK